MAQKYFNSPTQHPFECQIVPMFWKPFICIVFIHVAFADENQTFAYESRLFHGLFTDTRYDTNVRPVRYPTKAVVVEFSLSLIFLEELDLKNEVLVVNVWETMKWKDEFMKWNPEEYGGIKKIQVSSDRLWLPDVVLANEILDGGHPSSRAKPRAVVSDDGTVLIIPSFQLRSYCPINIRYFPFDTQHCSLKFMTWSYTGHQVDLSMLNNNSAELNEYSPSPAYKVFSFSAERHAVVYKSHDGDEKYMDVTVYIGLARRSHHYVYTLILPSVIIVILTLLMFGMSVDSGQMALILKIALGVTLLLVYYAMIWSLGEKLPETHTTPLFVIYLTIMMIVTGLSVILSISILNCYGKCHGKQVPSWIRSILCIGRVHVRQNSHIRKEMEKAAERLLSDTGDDKSDEPSTKKMLQLMLMKEECEKMKNEAENEWQAVAVAVDRLVFWCFTIITIVVSVYMLIVVPLTSRVEKT